MSTTDTCIFIIFIIFIPLIVKSHFRKEDDEKRRGWRGAPHPPSRWFDVSDDDDDDERACISSRSYCVQRDAAIVGRALHPWWWLRCAAVA